MNFFFGFFVGVGLVLLLSSGSGRKDSTDGPEGRSGMLLHTDHATGLQYLSIQFGGITPRLDRDGRHMRAEADQ